MITAITRGVSPSIASCQLEYLARTPIDVPKAAAQHRDYEAFLTSLGLRVISLPPDEALPDGLFVEDPAIVLDEVAIVCRLGAESRRAEAVSVAEALSPFRRLRWLREPGTLEGGDVMRIGKTLYCGISRRTNQEGARQLGDLLKPLGYTVVPVAVSGCLHLKSAICPLSDDAVLANRSWIDMESFSSLSILDVPSEEPAAANVLRIGETILMPSSFPQTRDLLEHSGFRVTSLEISELQKAEAGVTCSSLIFKT